MRRILIPALVAGLAAGAALAQDRTTRTWVPDLPGASTPAIKGADARRAETGRIVISVSGRPETDLAAYARWHFAQSEHGDGAARFAAD